MDSLFFDSHTIVISINDFYSRNLHTYHKYSLRNKNKNKITIEF